MRILVWSLTLFSDKMFSKWPANYCGNHTSWSFIEVASYCMPDHWLGIHHSLASHPEGLVAKAVPFGASFLSSFSSRPDISESSRTGNKPFLTQLRCTPEMRRQALSTWPCPHLHIHHLTVFHLQLRNLRFRRGQGLLCCAQLRLHLRSTTLHAFPRLTLWRQLTDWRSAVTLTSAVAS